MGRLIIRTTQIYFFLKKKILHHSYSYDDSGDHVASPAKFGHERPCLTIHRLNLTAGSPTWATTLGSGRTTLWAAQLDLVVP